MKQNLRNGSRNLVTLLGYALMSFSRNLWTILRAPCYLILSIFYFASYSIATEEPTEAATSVRFAGVPAVGFNPDAGFGGGVLGSIYFDKPGFSPYKMALGLQAYLTTKGMNSHFLQFDQVDAFGWPLRLTTRLGFF
jgi:hypothetical protein